MASIASSRRGRRQYDRDDLSLTIAGSFTDAISKFNQRFDGNTDDAAPQEVQLKVGCVARGSEEAIITLVDGQIPEGTKLHRGPVDCYKWSLEIDGSEIDWQFFQLDADAEQPIDLRACLWANDSLVDAARSWKPAPPPPRTYARLARQAGDSFLGFSVGSGNEVVKIAAGWTAVAFHLNSAMVVGRIDTSVAFQPLGNDWLELLVFDANGQLCLETKLTAITVKLDQTRIPAGDCLLAFRCGPGALLATGSYRQPHSTLLAELPEKPQLNDVLFPQSQPEFAPGVQVAVPTFRLEAQ